MHGMRIGAAGSSIRGLPPRRQTLAVMALVALTWLATTVVMAQGARHLDTGPARNTTPYLAEYPQGPVRAPSVGPTEGRRSALTVDPENDYSQPPRSRRGQPTAEFSKDASTDVVTAGEVSGPAAETLLGSSGEVPSTRRPASAGGGSAADAQPGSPAGAAGHRQSRSRLARSASTHSRTSLWSSGSTPSATIRARMSLTGSPRESPDIRSV